MKREIFTVLFGIVLSLILVEAGLRTLGVCYNIIHKLPKEDNATYRIFCVGESTTEGYGASDPINNGYPHQLENMLNNRFPDEKIQCFFDQTIGQNTSEILLKLPRYIKKYRPNMIIFMTGCNNWWNLDRSNILLFNKNSNISNITLRILIFLDKFRLWKLIKWVSLSLGIEKERWNYYLSPEEETSLRLKRSDNLQNQLKVKYGERVWGIFHKLAEHDISEMVKISMTNKIKVIICSYPISGRELYLIQKTIARRTNTAFVDNYAVFHSIVNVKDYLFEDGVHPNDRGYKLVAENIYDCILQNRLIE